MAEEENNFIKFRDFNIRNLSLRDKKTLNYRSVGLYYKYPDGKTRDIRLRTPVLFSYGIHRNKSDPEDLFMTLLPFCDEGNPTEKEVAFKEVLDNISAFLREEAPKECIVTTGYSGNLKELDIIKDNIFYPKLKRDKVARTNFYEKSGTNELKKIGDTSYLGLKKCKVIACIDFTDVFINSSVIKVRTSLSDVIIIEENVERIKKAPIISKVELYSEDEE